MADARLVDSKATFASFAHILDARLLRALADMGFARPTLVQSKAIPLALDGRDILARARTGSGKTAAYCIPIVQKILSTKAVRLSVIETMQSALKGHSLWHLKIPIIKVLVLLSWCQRENFPSKLLRTWGPY
jgi:hypothetical protein